MSEAKRDFTGDNDSKFDGKVDIDLNIALHNELLYGILYYMFKDQKLQM